MNPNKLRLSALLLALLLALTGCRNFSGKKLGLEEQRLLAFGAVLAEKNGMGYERVFDRNDDFLALCKESLRTSWGIADESTAKAALDALTLSARPANEETYNADELLFLMREPGALDDRTRESLSEILASYDACVAALKNDCGISQETIDGVQTTCAWEWDRLVTLARWCCACGYITEDELWNYATRVAESARNTYSDWEQYFAAIELGRALATGGGFSDADVAAKLFRSEDSPYKKYSFAMN